MHLLETIVRILAFLLGIAAVLATLSSAVRTFVVPRSDNVWLTRVVFLNVQKMLSTWMRWRNINTYEARDHIMAFLAPFTLLLLPVVWLFYVLTGYMFIFWSIGITSWGNAFMLSGSSMLTLGTVPFSNPMIAALEFSEAIIGLGMVALLMAYLPTMYSAFSKRETSVTMLEVRAGSPPSAIELIKRAHRIRGLDYLHELWESWELWFAELEESHTSLAPLIFFRSPQAERSWVTAAGAILDGAALTASTVAIPQDAQAQLCIRAGYLALRKIADFFELEYNADPRFPDDPISIGHDEFNEAYEELAAAGVPLKPDREQCWRDFAGWRVNYDTVLLALAAMTMAPYAPWSSDRSMPIRSAVFRSRFRQNGSSNGKVIMRPKDRENSL